MVSLSPTLPHTPRPTHPAGVASKQELQDSFKVSHLHSEGSGHLVVSVERDIIDMPTVAMAAQAVQAAQAGAGAVPAGAARDPGAAVAMGHPMMLRMWVPLWVINGTGLPITAGALQLSSTPCMLTAPGTLAQGPVCRCQNWPALVSPSRLQVLASVLKQPSLCCPAAHLSHHHHHPPAAGLIAMDDPQQQASDADAPQQPFARTPALEAPRAGGSTLRVMDTEATPGQQRLDSSLTIMAHSVDMMAFSQQDTTKQFAVQVGGGLVAVDSGYQVALAICAAVSRRM